MTTRVLIVEDEYLIRLLLEDMLVELGYEIAAVAPNLAEGIQQAQSAPIELAILDVNIGGEEIFPVADILKGRGVPFVFITGYGAQGLPPAYRDGPIVQKPFQIEKLKGILAQALALAPKA